MSKRNIVSKAKIARAVAAVQSAGLPIGRVEVDNLSGIVRVFPNGDTPPVRNEAAEAECDRLFGSA